MPESAEHQFLKGHVPAIISEFSPLRLYAYAEADRKLFDLSCVIERDWTRPLVGQVLWSHSRGLDKDLRSLLADNESEIKVLVARDQVKYRAALDEALGQYRRSGRFSDLFKLRVFWVPADFDADHEQMRQVVGASLREQVVDDLLFNVVFGRLTAEDVRLFLSASGMPGVNLATLYRFATSLHENYTGAAQWLRISAPPVREKVELLKGVGFLRAPVHAIDFIVTQKGRVFLELLRRLNHELHQSAYSAELTYILQKLNCPPVSLDEVRADDSVVPRRLFVGLVRTLSSAISRWDLDLDNITYAAPLPRSEE